MTKSPQERERERELIDRTMGKALSNLGRCLGSDPDDVRCVIELLARSQTRRDPLSLHELTKQEDVAWAVGNAAIAMLCAYWTATEAVNGSGAP